MMKKIVPIILFLLMVPAALALKSNGELCFINAECESDFCYHVCRDDPCGDGRCELTLDCIYCESGGDCGVAQCGFNTKDCADGICEIEKDCYCQGDGDCSALNCLFVNWKKELFPILATATAIISLSLLLKFRSKLKLKY